MEEKKDAPAVKIQSMEKAQRKIEKALSKAGMEYLPEHIHEPLETLYAAYEASGTVPTREAFAECCPDEEIRGFVREMEKDPFAANNKKKIAAVIAAVVAVLLVCGVAYGLSTTKAQTPNDDPAPTVTASPEATVATVDVTVKAEGTDADTTKAQVEVLDAEGQAVIPATEVPANEKTALGELEPGEYALRVVQAPVNTDGSTYVLPEEPTGFTVEDNDEGTVSLEVALEKLNAEDMSKEQLEATAQILADSGKSEASQTVTAKATAAPSRPGSADQVSAQPTPAPSNPGSSTNNNGGSSNNGGGSASEPAQPSHTHSWVEQTKTVYHDAEYKTVHHDAVTEKRIVCLGCNTSFSSAEAWADHSMSQIASGHTGCASNTVKTVTVQAAYDEQVLVKDAWSETVVTGYKCSGCGATK